MIIELDTKKILIILIIIVLAIGIAGAAYLLYHPEKEQTLQVKDLKIEKGESNLYKLKGHVTLLKDFDYLEARIIFYDEHNTIVGQSYAWNMLNPSKGNTIDLGGSPPSTCSGTPKYAVVSFYDIAGGNKPVANFTVQINNTTSTANNTTNTSTSTSSSSSNSPTIYAYKSDGTPMYSKTEADNYMLKKYGTDKYKKQKNGYIDPDSVRY
jgi:hypothetical protein